MVGREGDPEDLGFSVGEGEEVLVRKAHRAPDPSLGSWVQEGTVFHASAHQLEILHPAFLERRVPASLEAGLSQT